VICVRQRRLKDDGSWLVFLGYLSTVLNLKNCFDLILQARRLDGMYLDHSVPRCVKNLNVFCANFCFPSPLSMLCCVTGRNK